MTEDTDYQMILLKQILAEIGAVRTEQVKQGKDIAKLKVKAGYWGVIGGAVTTSAYVFSAWLKGVIRG